MRIGCRAGRWRLVVPIEDEFPEIAKYKDKIANYAVRDMTYNGKLYGLPYYADLITFQYNSKILADHGIACRRTWDQVLAACLKLKQVGMEKPIRLRIRPDPAELLSSLRLAGIRPWRADCSTTTSSRCSTDPNSEAFKHLQWLQDAVPSTGSSRSRVTSRASSRR